MEEINMGDYDFSKFKQIVIDQDKIEEALKKFDDFEKSEMYGSNSHNNASRMRKILEEVRKTLEK